MKDKITRRDSLTLGAASIAASLLPLSALTATRIPPHPLPTDSRSAQWPTRPPFARFK